jgi:hypothetical protein
VSDPVVFKVVRPFRSVDDFLAAEGRFMDLKYILVVGADPLPPDTLVRFGVDLESGEAVIRAEGMVSAVTAASDDAPAGLRIRFKRYGASTKAVLERARELRARQPKAKDDEPSAPLHSAPLQSAPEAAPLSEDLRSAPRRSAPPPSGEALRGLAAMRQRGILSVEAPPGRNELLGRLRQRAPH